MKFDDKVIPEIVRGIMSVLLKNGFEAYIIGGAVRDLFLKKEPHDWDLFTNASGEKILKLFPHGIVMGSEERQEKILTVIVDGVEVSQYRKSGDRTKTGNSLKAHCGTCDFTINALVMDINGVVTDFFGGIEDLAGGFLKTVGSPKKRIQEDKLRVLRAVRFECKYGFEIRNDLANTILKTDISSLPTERIKDEFTKILEFDNGVEVLHKHNLLVQIIPEFIDMMYILGGKYHAESPFEHSLYAYKYISRITDNKILKLSAFLHDIGKAESYIEKDGEVHFYKHEIKGAKVARAIMDRLKFSNDEIDYVITMIKNHMFTYGDARNKKSYLKFFAELEKAKIPIEEYIMLIWSDQQGNMAKPRIKFGDFVRDNNLLKKYWKFKYEGEPFSIKDLKVKGQDLLDLGLTPGKRIGVLLSGIFDMVQDGELLNDRTILMNYLRNKLKK